MKKIYFIFLLIPMLVLAGCGEDPDCSSYDTTYQKFSYNSETKQCEVTRNIQRDVCGNGIIEKDETYCNCPEDVPEEHPEFGCFGAVGAYLEKTCNQKKECGLYQNERVVEQTRSLDFRNSDITFSSRITLGSPFIQFSDDNNKISINLEVFQINTNVQITNINVQNLLIEGTSTGTLYAEVPYNQKVTNRGDKLTPKQIELAAAPKYEHKEQLRLTLAITYDRSILDRDGNVVRTEQKVERLVASLGNWDIINPNLE